MNHTDTQLETKRHSLSHLLAQAVLRLYPDAKLGIGPATEDGFYYDFEIKTDLTNSDLSKIEDEMKKIVKEDYPFTQVVIPRQQAFDALLQIGQIYKTELLQQVPDEMVSFYKTGDEFIDLCRGPHLKSTGQLNGFKLIGLTKVHWLNDESRPKMQRIIGLGFSNDADLAEYSKKQTNQLLNDHRKVGEETELFNIDDDRNLLWLPKSNIVKMQVRNMLEEFLQLSNFALTNPSSLNNIEKYNPNSSILNILELNQRSQKINQIIKIYNYKKRGYKELPYRLSEISEHNINLPDHDFEGALRSNVSFFDQNYIFLDKTTLVDEVARSFQLMIQFIKKFGFSDYRFELIIPNKYVITNLQEHEPYIEEAVSIFEKVIDQLKYIVKISKEDSGMFGPTIVIKIRDTYEREWDLSSITIDLITPIINRMKYINNRGKETIPGLIQLSFLGSFERLLALLIEQNYGKLPKWLAPVQVKILSISEKFVKNTKDIAKKIKAANIKVELDIRDETIAAKIRDAQLERVPFILIVGEKEIKTNSVSMRTDDGKEVGLIRVEDCIELIQKDISDKA